MVLFAFACIALMVAVIVHEMASAEGVVTVSPKVWYAVLAAMGVWLFLLAA